MSDSTLERSLPRMRIDYESHPLDVDDLAPTWHEQLAAWMDAAREASKEASTAPERRSISAAAQKRAETSSRRRGERAGTLAFHRKRFTSMASAMMR